MAHRASSNLGESGNGSVYEQITNRIIALMEAGTIPWRKPWNAKTEWPRNLVSNKPYRGVNVFLLHAMQYQSPFWLTFNQANHLGGRIRRGEKACPVVFWKQLEVENKKTGEKEKVRLLRFYHVFNVSQCDDIKDAPPLSDQLGTITAPMEIIEKMPKRPAIKHGMRSAFYCPAEDFVAMPSLTTFSSEESYFGTIYHELCHASGHSSRLNRPTLAESQGFGSDPYCKEELIAEMGAAFLCGQAGIADTTITNSAAYIQNWMKRLRNDKTLVIHAAAQAQHAADFILGTSPESPTTPEGIQ